MKSLFPTLYAVLVLLLFLSCLCQASIKLSVSLTAPDSLLTHSPLRVIDLCLVFFSSGELPPCWVTVMQQLHSQVMAEGLFTL